MSPSSIPTPTAPPAIDLATGTPAGWASSADGSSYQVSVMHDGYAGDVHLKGSRAWTRDWLRIAGAPVIADGLLFAGVVPGRAEGRTDVVALHLRTGAPAWRHDIGDARTVGFALDHGRLFALAADGTLWAFDATTGHLVWRVTMPAPLWYSAPPTAAGGVLYVAGNGYLYAVDEEDGVIAWKQGVAGDTSAPALFATSVVAGYACFQVPAFDTVTGKTGWNHTGDCSGGGGQASVYYDGRIYARSGNEGLVLDASDGREVGRFTSAYAPAFYDGIGYFVDDGVLEARDLVSLDVVWSVGKTGGFVCAPIIAGGNIYIGDRFGDLVEIDQLGRVLRKAPLTPPRLPSSDPGPVALNAGDGVVVMTTMTRLAVFS